MFDILYKISFSILALLLLLMIVLISIVGVEESTMKILGWITSFFIVSTSVLFFLRSREK